MCVDVTSFLLMVAKDRFAVINPYSLLIHNLIANLNILIISTPYLKLKLLSWSLLHDKGGQLSLAKI